MKQLFSITCIIFLLGLPALSEPVEVIGIPSYVQGIWQGVASSPDKGKTIKNINANFCRVFGTKVVMTDGTVLTVRRVAITNIGKENYIGITFDESDTLWVVSVTGNLIMVQIFNEDKETCRFFFRIVL